MTEAVDKNYSRLKREFLSLIAEVFAYGRLDIDVSFLKCRKDCPCEPFRRSVFLKIFESLEKDDDRVILAGITLTYPVEDSPRYEVNYGRVAHSYPAGTLGYGVENPGAYQHEYNQTHVNVRSAISDLKAQLTKNKEESK